MTPEHVQDLARMKRRYLIWTTLLVAAGAAVNGWLYGQVQASDSQTCRELTSLVAFTRGSYLDLIERLEVIAPGDRTAAADAQLATLQERLAVLDTIRCEED